MRHSTAGLAMVGVAAAVAVAAAPVAGAQIPGNNPRTTVFPVDDTRITIAVDGADLDAGTVKVTIQNNSNSNLSCTGINGSPAATVTTAETVARAVDFYTQFPNTNLADLTLEIPQIGNQVIPLGSVTGQLGSAGEYMNPEWAAIDSTQKSLEGSRLRGQYGTIAAPLAVSAQQAVVRDVRLDHPVEGARKDFQTGVFLTCELGGQRYVFHAYEGDSKPIYSAPDAGLLPLLGLGS